MNNYKEVKYTKSDATGWKWDNPIEVREITMDKEQAKLLNDQCENTGIEYKLIGPVAPDSENKTSPVSQADEDKE